MALSRARTISATAAHLAKLLPLNKRRQRRRSVVKYGGQGQSGKAVKLFQPYVNDFQTLSNPGSLIACIGASKN